ncbi:MAG: hypothetical protein IKO39_00710 [Treponema sp.]|nr:hypothetical protein [Treponema sp.]
MKKVLKNLFVVFTAAALLGTFVSCGNGDENDDVLNVEKDYGSKTGEEPTKPDNPSEAVDTPDDNKENQGGQNPTVPEEDFEEVEVTALAGKETSWGNENFLKVGTDYTSKLTLGSRIYFDVAKNGEYLKFHVDNGSWGNCGVTKYFKNDGSEVTKLDEDTNNKGVWNMEGEDGVYYVTVTSENIDKLKAGFGIHGNLVINKVTLKIKKDSSAVPEQEEPETPATTEEDHGLLSAAVDLAWDAGATVEAAKLADATDTSKFVVTYTSNDDNDYHTFKMRVVSPEQELFEGKEEGISINRTSEKKDDLHGCSFVNAPAATANTFSYQPSAAEWAKLKAGGFNVYGHGAKITKITLEAGTEIAEPSQGEPETTPTEPETPAQEEPTTPVTEPETPATTEPETPATEAESPATTEPTYTEVWTGEQAIDWGENGIVIDHANFPADFTAVRITYNASEGALKMAVCDPWTDISATSVSAGSIAADGAINLPIGDAQSVTIDLSADSVAGIIGQGHDKAWGGLKIYGADTITVTKVEAVKK